MGNEMFQARLPDEFAEEVHEYRKENHMSKSEAVRHLIRVGMEAEDEDEDDAQADSAASGFLERLAQDIVFIPAVLFGIIGTLFPFVGLFAMLEGMVIIGGIAVWFGLLLMIGSTIVSVASVLAQLALAQPARGLLPFGKEAST